MKKIYLLIIAVGFISAGSFAQQRIAKAKTMDITYVQPTVKNQPSVQPMNVVDTLANHWDVIAPVPVDNAVTYSSQGGGYVGGQNGYGDLAKAQKFDATYGVAYPNGSITNLLLWVGAKKQNAGTAAWTPTIWGDNAGIPGTVLGTATPVTVAQMDTSAAGILGLIGSSTAVEGAFNINAVFSPAIAIPGNQIFWAGFSITYAAGDSAGLVTSRDTTGQDGIGVTGDFFDATTHTFELWSPSPWTTFNDGTIGPGPTWGLDIALAVYPVVDFVVGVNEQNTNVLSLSNIPNPATDNTTIHYELKEAGDVSISVVDITGKEVFAQSQGVKVQGNHQMKLDVSALNAGMYFYTLTAGNYKMTSKMSVVK